MSRKQTVWESGKRNTIRIRLWIFGGLAVLLILVAVFAKELCPYDPAAQDLSKALQPPGGTHLLGTDRFGRDMLSRIIAGARISVFSALILVAVTAVTGTLLGVLCGYFGGWVDAVMMRISDICLAFPGLVAAMGIAAVLGGGIQNAVVAIAVVSWPKYARLARSQTLAVREEPYVAASRLAGSRPDQIIFRHVIPNVAGSILVTAVLDIGTMMMEIAALSFLGLGAQTPTAEWGSMMSDGRSMLQTYPWVVLTPGLAIFISVAVFNLLGDTLRDYLDPRRFRGQKDI